MSRQIRTLIVDDEPAARRGLRRLLESQPDVLVVGEAGHGKEALTLLKEQEVDVLFLDIQMPEINGFQVAAQIPSPAPLIVFVTAFDQYALQAFEIHAFDYVLKPIDKKRFSETFARVRKQWDLQQGDSGRNDQLQLLLRHLHRDPVRPSRLAIKDEDCIRLIEVTQIEVLEAQGNYVLIHAEGKKYLQRTTMQALEKHLSGGSFVRISRSHLVNMEQVESLWPAGKGAYDLTLRTGFCVRSSRRYLDQIQPWLQLGRSE